MIPLIDATRSKVEHALQRVRGLRSPVTPQRDAETALVSIATALTAHRETLNSLANSGADEAVVSHACDAVLAELFAFLPTLGFIHRAQHPCNPFEAYDPLRRLARRVIGEDTQIVISSEWDYSPLTYVWVPGLPNLVFIGLPASEVENAFLLPLAGHEFGHSVWFRGMERDKFADPVIAELLKQIRARWDLFQEAFPEVTDESTLATDLTAVGAWKPAWRISLLQCEEVFCDLVGLWLFGESYASAFTWLLAPGLNGGRSAYPLARTRVRILAAAAARWGIAVPADIEEQFLPLAGAPDLSLALADATVEELAPAIMDEVERILAAKGLARPKLEVVEAVAARLRLAVPSALASTLPELLCGAWRLRNDADLWRSPYRDLAEQRERILNELLLKSAQCLEWRERLEAAA